MQEQSVIGTACKKQKVFEVAKAEFAAKKESRLKRDPGCKKSKAAKPAAAEEDVKEPPKEIVTAQIAGIEVMDLEDAVKSIMEDQYLRRERNGLYRTDHSCIRCKP